MLKLIFSITVLCTEIDQVKVSFKEVEDGLSMWSDEVITLQSTVSVLKTDVMELKDNCDNMEGRMRRCNLRMLGVPETPRSASVASVAKLLAEVF